VFFFFNLKPG